MRNTLICAYVDKYALETNQLGFAVQLAGSVYETGNSAPEKGDGHHPERHPLVGGKISIAISGTPRISFQGRSAAAGDGGPFLSWNVRKDLLTTEQAEKSPLQNILTRAGRVKAPQVDLGDRGHGKRRVPALPTDSSGGAAGEDSRDTEDHPGRTKGLRPAVRTTAVTGPGQCYSDSRTLKRKLKRDREHAEKILCLKYF